MSGQVTTKYNSYWFNYRAQILKLVHKFQLLQLTHYARGVKNIVLIWNVQLKFAPTLKHMPTPCLAEA
jgi:hypothetical protein